MSRDKNLLHPEVKKIALKMEEECKKQGLNVKVTDCFRTKEEQNTVGASRTNAKYPYSFHNWGLAFDVCQNVKDNPYPNDTKWWKKVGAIGKKLGMEWGGDWSGFVDLPHFEYAKFGSISQLMRKYGTPEKFQKHSDWTGKTETSTSQKKWTSVVDYLVYKGMNHSFSNRSKLAKSFGIKGSIGTAKQNTHLLEKLIEKYGK